jgi:dolichol-phosphate mannosyltransferase
MSAIVVIPTYNEKDNIENLIQRVLSADPHVHVLIVDDNSPDGTAGIVKTLSLQCDRIHLLLLTRRAPLGRGYADRLGLKFAIEQGFDYILQMDADLSHQPEDIPRFLKAIRRADVVIGSRLIQGGCIVNRGPLRNIVTRLANAYIRWMLGLKTHDCTSGFRCYRREVLSSLELQTMVSPGPSLLEEILYACQQRQYVIHEIPIQFMGRQKGRSKLGIFELIQILFLIAGFKHTPPSKKSSPSK